MAKRAYVSFSEVKEKVPIPDALQTLGLLDQFQRKGNVLTGVCPLPAHQHGPNPNAEQFKINRRDGIWLFHCFGDCSRGGDVIELVKSITGYDDAHGAFVLRTKAGETLRRPSKARVDELIKAGQVPEWFVSRQWLTRQYGQRAPAGERTADKTPGDGDSHSDKTADRLRESAERHHEQVVEQYEKQIADLQADKEALRQEKREALQLAQQDKQMFADAVRRLTQFLSQPAIVDAVQVQLDQPASSPESNAQARPSPPAANAKAAVVADAGSSYEGKSSARRQWWSRLWKRS